MKDFNDEMQRDHSRLFNVHAWTEHKAVKELVRKIFASFSPEDQEKLVRVDAAHDQIVVGIFAVVEVKAAQSALVQQESDNLFDVDGLRMVA